jgi:hypothetical protein
VTADAPSPRPRSARDYYLEPIRGSQLRPGFLGERERWLHSVEVDGREELLFELEMLLRGLERYFNLHNLPLDQGRPVVMRDFSPELSDVRDALDRAIRLGRHLLDPGLDQKMLFRRYVESLMADDRARRELLEEELDQSTPSASLFVLRQSFESLRTVADHLLKLERGVGFAAFTDVGNLVLREVVLNQYFRPFRSLEFRIEYDRIKSVPLLEALCGLPEEERRLFTLAFLSLFRMLHYLSYVGEDQRRGRARIALDYCRLVGLGLGDRGGVVVQRLQRLADGVVLAAGRVHHRQQSQRRGQQHGRGHDRDQDAEQALFALLQPGVTLAQAHGSPSFAVSGFSSVAFSPSGFFFLAPASSGHFTSYSSTYFCLVVFTCWLIFPILAPLTQRCSLILLCTCDASSVEFTTPLSLT